MRAAPRARSVVLRAITAHVAARRRSGAVLPSKPLNIGQATERDEARKNAQRAGLENDSRSRVRTLKLFAIAQFVVDTAKKRVCR